MNYKEIHDPYPDNISDDGVSFAPASWMEIQEQRAAQMQKAVQSQQANGILGLMKSMFM